MAKRIPPFAVLVGLVAVFHPAVASGSDTGEDHPLVDRYEGSEIVRYATEDLAEYPLIVREVTHYGGLEKNLDAVQKVEGKLTRITYQAPGNPTTQEVFRAHREALQSNGFSILFACSGAECGGRYFNHASPGYRAVYAAFGENYQDQSYLAARLSRDQGDVYVAVHTARNTSSGGPTRNKIYTQVDVIEESSVAEGVEAAEPAAETTQPAPQEVDLAFCRCRKMYYLDETSIQECRTRFGDLDETQMAAKTAACREADPEDIYDPFADALAGCTPYRGTFRHPLTGQPLEREILGLEAGSCRYQEEMPGGGLMHCAWPQEKLADLASWYRYADFRTSVHVRSTTSLGEEGATTETVVTTDGAPSRSPLEQSLAAGECTVEGY